jgi:hypothetical protein
MDAIVKQFKLISPALLAVICLLGAALPTEWLASLPIASWIKMLGELQALSFVGWILPDEQHSNIGLVRIVLVFVAGVLLASLAVRDYSQFFPQRFNVKVFFDEEGIDKTLRQFTDDEATSLRLASDWQTARRKYFQDMNARLAAKQLSFRFQIDDGLTNGSGVGELKGRLLDRWGFQKYRLSEGGGRLTFATTVAGGRPTQLFTSYSLLDTNLNEIEVSLADIYLLRPIVIMPEFKQMIYLTAEEELVDHILATATKIKFAPFVDIGWTLYLYKQSDGWRVPIGYAIYDPMR